MKEITDAKHLQTLMVFYDYESMHRIFTGAAFMAVRSFLLLSYEQFDQSNVQVLFFLKRATVSFLKSSQ